MIKYFCYVWADGQPVPEVAHVAVYRDFGDHKVYRCADMKEAQGIADALTARGIKSLAAETVPMDFGCNCPEGQHTGTHYY